MHGFQPVTLTWKGARFTVAPEDQLRLIAEIEDALRDQRTGAPAIAVLTRKGGPSYGRLAPAYGAALRYAGADVTDDEVYLSIAERLGDGDPTVAIETQSACLGLLAIIAPPLHRRITSDDAPEKPTGEGSETAAE